MISYRGMTFCTDAEQCANRETCSRWFSPDEQEKARKWWKGDDAPVSEASFKETCDKWELMK